MRYKISENFYIDEFVPKQIHDVYGERSRRYINPKIVDIVQLIRTKAGAATTVNNWIDGGQYNESGYRVPDTITGARLSQHKLGNAADVKVKGMTPKQVLDLIYLHLDEFLAAGLTTIEDISYTPTWIHLSVEWTLTPDKITIVKP